MKRFLPLVLILVAAVAFADFPGSPIGGGSGGGSGDMTEAAYSTGGIIKVSKGGTGSDNAAGARANLGADNASNLTDGTLAIGRGGTGAGTAGAALTALGGDNASNVTKGTLPVAQLPTGIDAANLIDGSVDNTELGYVSGVTSAIQTQLNAKAPINNPTFTGTVTLGSGGIVSTCSPADNQCGSTTVNAGSAADNILQAGLSWTDNSMECYRTRNNDNTLTYSVGCMVKAFPIIIDNVVAADNVLLFRTPRALTLLRADCYASVDNVIGNLMECSTSDVASCSVLDAWTVTNATSPFSDTSMTDGAVAAGAWIRWSTTSVGTASMNRLTCTVQYRE